MEKYGVTAFNRNIKQSEIKKSEQSEKTDENPSLDKLAEKVSKTLKELKSRGNK